MAEFPFYFQPSSLHLGKWNCRGFMSHCSGIYSYSLLVTVSNVVAARLCFHRHLWFCSWGGRCIKVCTGADTPLADSSPPRADTPQADTSPGQTPPQQTPSPPPPTATVADGTQPTGMHSCNDCEVNLSSATLTVRQHMKTMKKDWRVPALPTIHAKRTNINTPNICWIVGKYTPSTTPSLAFWNRIELYYN